MRQQACNPYLPVPRHEQARLALVGRLALAELQGTDPAQALIDLHAVAQLCCLLTAGSRYTDDARRTAQEAVQALESARAGTTLPATALGAASALVVLFEQVLPVITLRRLLAAQDEVAGGC